MPCGKKRLVKTWDKPRNIRVVKPSRYQQNEASVKVHWKNVIREIELLYKDEQFWETQGRTVRELVGPVIFERLSKIFSLDLQDEPYVPASEPSTVMPSEQFYTTGSHPRGSGFQTSYSYSYFSPEEGEEEGEVEEEELWSVSSRASSAIPEKTKSKSKSLLQLNSTQQSLLKSYSKIMSKSLFSKTFNRSYASKFTIKSEDTSSGYAETNDDLRVHAMSVLYKEKSLRKGARRPINPHFLMLYCNESETDMIKWKSKYKQKAFQISASDEYSKKAELLTKQIAHDFFEWWTNLGSEEYKSEIKRPVDIEGLFQVWFDEHASRGLMLDPKILPCVLQSIADYVGVPQASCPCALKRQIEWDIHAETSPAHKMAFETCLPHHLKHIPPKNNTEEIWHAVRIPEDLKSMSAVWGGISHLTSTKAFHKWLQQRPYAAMPPCLKELEGPVGDKKQLFVVPSDFVFRDKSMDAFSSQDLALPISQFSLEIKEVLSRLLND